MTKIEWARNVDGSEGRATGEWAPLPSWEGYFVSDDGRIWGPRGLRRLQQSPQGYLYVQLYRRGAGAHGKGRSTKVWAHQAVLQAFVGPCPSGCETRHLDDDPTNNRLNNLCWGTRLENVQDKLRNGGQPRGASSSSAVLTQSEVDEIRQLHGTGTVSLRSLARKFGISHTATRRAALGITWSSGDGS